MLELRARSPESKPSGQSSQPRCRSECLLRGTSPMLSYLCTDPRSVWFFWGVGGLPPGTLPLSTSSLSASSLPSLLSAWIEVWGGGADVKVPTPGARMRLLPASGRGTCRPEGTQSWGRDHEPAPRVRAVRGTCGVTEGPSKRLRSLCPGSLTHMQGGLSFSIGWTLTLSKDVSRP